MKFILKQSILAFFADGNAEMQNTFPALHYFFYITCKGRPRNLKLFKGQLNALLSSLAFCENENEYA